MMEWIGVGDERKPNDGEFSSFIYKPKQTKLKNTSRKMTQKEKEIFCQPAPILMFGGELEKIIEDRRNNKGK